VAKKRKNKTGPLRRPDDTPHTHEVIDWALGQRLPVWRPASSHLKIGPWNYYPTKRTFNSDVAVRVKLVGFEEFQRAVLKWLANERRKWASLRE